MRGKGDCAQGDKSWMEWRTGRKNWACCGEKPRRKAPHTSAASSASNTSSSLTCARNDRRRVRILKSTNPSGGTSKQLFTARSRTHGRQDRKTRQLIRD